MDMDHDVPVLFVDASVTISEGFSVERIRPQSDHSVTTHTISPGALLRLFELTLHAPAPEAYLLHVAGRSFALGEEISARTSGHAEEAWAFLQDIFTSPGPQWRSRLSAACAADAGGPASDVG